MLQEVNKGDDSFFHAFLEDRHGTETVENLKPNLAEHVDLWIGGSVLRHYRDYQAKAHYWQDDDLVLQLRAALRARREKR